MAISKLVKLLECNNSLIFGFKFVYLYKLSRMVMLTHILSLLYITSANFIHTMTRKESIGTCTYAKFNPDYCCSLLLLYSTLLNTSVTRMWRSWFDCGDAWKHIFSWSYLSLYSCLTKMFCSGYIFQYIFNPKRVIGKQCRPRSDAAECGIWSGSPLFANILAIFL